MNELGLTSSQLKAFERALRSTHQMRTHVYVQRLDGRAISNVSDRLIDGQVNFDSSAETSRQLSLTLDDPERALSLDSTSPSDGALYADRMLRVDYGVYVDELKRWIDVPIFTGPVTAMTRNGSQVELSCLSKEHLAMSHAWRPLKINKGTNVANAIRTILRERAGETRFAFPNVKARVGKPGVSLGPMSQPWVVATQLARSIGLQLYYDGAGVCRMRRAGGSVFTFTGDVVLSDPAIAYDLSSIVNTVRVLGKKGGKGKPNVRASAVAPRSHVLSPWSIGRAGTPRHYVEVIDNDKIKTNAKARQLARQTLNGRLREGVTCDFDALPQPHLEPLDVVRLSTPNASVTFNLHRASIPLVHSGVMSVGTNKRVTINRKRIR